jgi:hypothetical protein
MLSNQEIELYVNSIYKKIIDKEPLEDSFLELKREFIKPPQAARRIAGHANSSHNSPILWVIGLDEKEGLIGLNRTDFEEWWQKTKSCFDEIYPSIIVHLNIPIEGKTVSAIYFDTNRSPYVVKNSEQKPFDRDVPIREGTTTRSATRIDLLNILVPRNIKPEFEFISGDFYVRNDSNNNIDLGLTIHAYIKSSFESPINIPFYKSKARIIEPSSNLDFDFITLKPPNGLSDKYRGFRKYNTPFLINTQEELVVNGSGHIEIEAHRQDANFDMSFRGKIKTYIEFNQDITFDSLHYILDFDNVEINSNSNMTIHTWKLITG